jgi:hypothetical protein
MNSWLCILHVQQYVNPWNGRLIITLVLMLRMVPSVSVTLSKQVSASLRRSGTHAYNQTGPDNVSYLSPSTFLCWQTVIAGNKVAYRNCTCTDSEVWRNASALISGVRLSKGRKANLDSSRSASLYLPILVNLWNDKIDSNCRNAVRCSVSRSDSCKLQKMIPRFQVSDHLSFF